MFAYYPSHAHRRHDYEAELELLRRQAARRAYEEELAQQAAERRRQQAAYEARVRRQLAEREAYEEALERERYRQQLAQRQAYEEAMLRRRQQRQPSPVYLFTPAASSPAPKVVVQQQQQQASLAARQRAATLLQRHYRAHRSTMHHLQELASLRAELNKLMDDFIFPETLEVDANGKLTFGGANAIVHAYEDALTRLLTRLDAVESNGSDTVRAGRKSIVLDIEAELASLDARKAEAARSLPSSAPVDAAPVHVEAGPATDGPSAEPTVEQTDSAEAKDETMVADVDQPVQSEAEQQKEKETVEVDGPAHPVEIATPSRTNKLISIPIKDGNDVPVSDEAAEMAVTAEQTVPDNGEEENMAVDEKVHEDEQVDEELLPIERSPSLRSLPDLSEDEDKMGGYVVV